MAGNRHDNDQYVSSVENSLVEMERRISDIMPSTPSHPTAALISSPSMVDDNHHDGRKVKNNTFRRGASSINFQASELKRPRMKKRLSNWGLTFLILALVQGVIIAGLQITIAIVGKFQEGRLEEYVECVEKQYNQSNMTLADNSTFPSFGEDKQIYVYIFMFLSFYNFGLCLYALLAQRIVEVISFVVINFLLVAYASVQVYQFRGFGEFCDPITKVGWLALINALVILLCNIVFCFLTVEIYVEFGWKLYKFVNCNPALRYYYRNYEIFLSIVKVIIIFTIAFLIGQCALILPLSDYEFWLSFPFIMGMIFLYFYAFFMTGYYNQLNNNQYQHNMFYVHKTVRRESHLAAAALLFIGILLIFYFGFKIYRYVTRSCPVCIVLDEALNDRREDFEHLVMMATVNMIISLAYIIIVIRVWTQYGRGLGDHFYIHGFWFDRILKQPPREEAYRDSVGTGAMIKQKVELLKFQKKHNGVEVEETDSKTTKRYSSLDENEITKDIIFTPSVEFKFLPLATEGHTDIARTTSLPPIMEEYRHKRN